MGIWGKVQIIYKFKKLWTKSHSEGVEEQRTGAGGGIMVGRGGCIQLTISDLQA